VAEQLALEEVERNGRAVELHERMAASGAELMDGPRDQLFAGASLAMHEHRRVGRRDALDLLEDGF
jgi:hypothetical protein